MNHIVRLYNILCASKRVLIFIVQYGIDCISCGAALRNISSVLTQAPCREYLRELKTCLRKQKKTRNDLFQTLFKYIMLYRLCGMSRARITARAVSAA